MHVMNGPHFLAHPV